MAGSDDLSTILAAPSGDSPPYAQGVIKQWDPDTFENLVTVHGRDLENLPVKSSVEALTYQEGDTVILARWSGSAGAPETWWIDGRAVIPGTGRGEEAIAFMTTALGSAVAKSVIAETIHFDTIETNGNFSTASTWEDLDDEAGPTVEVEIGDSGVMVVMVGGNLTLPDDESQNVHMSYEISGETSRAPDVLRSLGFRKPSLTQAGDLFQSKAAAVFAETDLNPGAHTVQAKYQAFWQVGALEPSVTQRTLVVIAF